MVSGSNLAENLDEKLKRVFPCTPCLVLITNTPLAPEVPQTAVAAASFNTSIDGEGKTRTIEGLRRVSKPGLRIYASCKDIPKVRNGLGIAIISTSKGLMTDKKARKENIGGEVLAFVW